MGKIGEGPSRNMHKGQLDKTKGGRSKGGGSHGGVRQSGVVGEN